jgi:hypothetical protein
MAKKTAPAKKTLYTATAKVMGKNFTATGETISEAISGIKPGGVAGMVIITVEKDGVSKDRIIPMITARRIFTAVGMTREIALKNISSMFSGI